MTLTETFVLPPTTVVVPVSRLTGELREAAGAADGDFAVSRSNSRRHSKIVDADSAALLAQFRMPSTIAAAVARFSKNAGVDAEHVLEEALPMLISIIRGGLLVPSNQDTAILDLPVGRPLTELLGWEVLRLVQSLEDSTIYQVRARDGTFGALKLGAVGNSAARRTLEREGHILKELDGAVTPQLLEAGDWNAYPFIVTQWFAGSDADVVCAEFRKPTGACQKRLLSITTAILRAYVHLHNRRVMHGDVHPGNVLIDRAESVRIIDLGNAISASEPDRPIRGGVSFFFDPELATAIRRGAACAPVSAHGEQYSVAAMLYFLLTGSHYIDFIIERGEMLRQITEESMVPFVKRGIEWPSVEHLLEKALSKSPADRFASTSDFLHAWEAAGTSDLPLHSEKDANSQLIEIRDDMRRLSAIDGALLNATPMPAPSTSLNYGSAGLACALHRIASVTDSGALFATADAWSTQAVREIGDEGAFLHSELEIPRERIGAASLYHGPAGVYAVAALIATAREDERAQRAAVRGFLRVVDQPCEPLDLALGRAGALLGCALLLEAIDNSELRATGTCLLAEIWRTIDAHPQIRESVEFSSLGIAHGWAGVLYATLCWCHAAGHPHPPQMTRRLKELAECAEPAGRGVQWRVDVAQETLPTYVSGWCNGSAGHVFLWTGAYRSTGLPYYLKLAEGAAWHAWENPVPNASLCCGMSGQAYALLNFCRQSGDPIWLRRAKDFARHAARISTTQPRAPSDDLENRQASLYKGDAGLAVLAADLERPEEARMPMFECEALSASIR